MSDMLVDLHFHTTRSDGVWSVERVLEEVRNREVELFCLSDHDTLDAYHVPEDLKPHWVPGAEIDTEYCGRTAHVLAYGVDDCSGSLASLLHAQREERVERARLIVDRLNRLGIALTFEDVRAHVKGNGSIGRPHIARALVAKGKVDTVQQAFDRYLAESEGGYVPLRRLATAQAIGLIHESGATAVVAHPWRLHSPRDLEEICALGVDGVEVVHPTADDAYQTALFEFADQRGLLTTAGSDFHAPEEARLIGVLFPRVRVQRFLEKIAAPA